MAERNNHSEIGTVLDGDNLSEIKKVLVIDDSKIILQIVTEHLSSAGYKVTSAPDGKSGLKALKQNGADIVITDLVMPPPDGLKVIETIKKNFPEIPVIVLSGQGGVEEVKKALKLGAYDYLTKADPGIDSYDLIAAVHRAWDKLKLTRELEDYKNHLEAKVEERTQELKKTKELFESERQISDAQKSEIFKKLEYSEKKYKTVMANASSGIATVMSGGKITALNNAFIQILGFNFESELQNKSIYDNKYFIESGRVLEKTLSCFNSKKESRFDVLHYIGPDRIEKDIEYILTPILMDEHGFEIEVLFTVNDVTLEREEKQRLITEAMYDGLTGLINQDNMNPQMTNSIAHAKKNGHLLGVVHIDLDDFSEINEKYGHPAASEILGLVGQRIKSSIQQDRDFGFRSGGDEFLVVFCNFSEGTLGIIVRRLFNKLSELYTIGIEGIENDVKCTFSVGVSEYSVEKEQSADELYKEADDATFEAKKEGKNRFVFYGTDNNS